MSSESVDIILRLQGERVLAVKTRKAARDIDKLGDAGERTRRKQKGLNQELRITSTVLKLIKPAAAISAIGLLTQGVSALSAGAVGLVAGISPVVGALGAMPGLGLGAAQGIGIFKLAVDGVMDAVGALNSDMDLEKLAALTPDAQYLAVALDELKTPIRDLQGAAQDGILPGLMEAAKGAGPALKLLTPVVTMTADAINDIVEATIGMVKGWKRDIPSMGATGAGVVRNLGLGAVGLATALWDVMYAAQPLVLWIARSARAWGDSAAKMAAAGRESGTLSRFFDQVRRSMTLVMGLLRPLAVSFTNIMTAALPSGELLLGMLTEQAEQFAKWSGSVSGQNAIADWFKQGMPAVIEMGRIVRDLARGFVQLGNGEQVAPLLKMFREDLMPVLGALIQKTTSEFAPVLIAALSQVIGLFATMAGATGPAGIIVRMLGATAQAANWILTEVPGAKMALGGLIALLFAGAAVSKGRSVLLAARSDIVAVGSASKRAFGLVKSGADTAALGMSVLRDVYVAQTGVTNASNFAILRHAAAQKLAAVGAGIASAAQWVWNGALAVGATAMSILTSPITLVILGIAAMVVAVVLVVRHWGFFHDKLKSVWGWITNAWGSVKDSLRAPVGAAVQWMRDKLTGLVDFVKSLPSKLATAGKGMWSWVSTGLGDAFAGAGSWALEIGKKLANGLIKGVNRMLPDAIAIPGAPNINLPNNPIPMLATGGVVSKSPGSWITGEAGPEVNSFDGNRVRVQPLTKPASAAPSGGLAAMLAAASGAVGGGDRTIQVVLPDGRVLAEVVDEYAGDVGARG